MTVQFADRLTNVQIAANTVRLEFSVLEIAPGAKSDEPRWQVSHVLAIPLDGFVQAFNSQEVVIKKLIADGILKTAQTEAQVS